MKKICFLLIILLIPYSANAKSKTKFKYPAIKAQFLTKNTWRKTNSVSSVKISCFSLGCTWTEVQIDQCYLNTTQLILNFHPYVYNYSTEGDDSHIDKMTFKTVSPNVYSISLDAGRNIKPQYVIKLKCPTAGVMIDGCEVQSATGSMVDENAETTSYTLINLDNVKDLKLDRCQPEPTK